MPAVPFNNNDIFKKQLNNKAVKIGLNKTIAYYRLKCKNRPATYLSTVIDYPISVSVNMTDLMMITLMHISDTSETCSGSLQLTT